MTTPSFGYISKRPKDEPVTVTGEDFSKPGIVSTSDDADPSVFPLNTSVRFTSTDGFYLAKAGTGYIADALRGINDQLGGKGADVSVVRVAEGADANPVNKLRQTLANVVGDPGNASGLWALRAGINRNKAIPRLIAVPGWTSQQPDGIDVDNPVRVALPVHLEAMRAISIVDVDPSSKEKAIAARELMASDRMMALGVAAKVYETINGAATLVTRPMSSRILGTIIASDNNNGGKPFSAFANRAIFGIADINRPITFSLEDGATEGQLMLADDVAIVTDGEIANDGAIADGGFYFVGVESAESGELWSQIHQVRAADYLDVKMMKITREYLGGNITPRRAEAWLVALKFMLKAHVDAEEILGFRLDFPALLNSLEDVRLGELEIETRAEPAPVFRRAVNNVRRYRPAVQALVDAIQARAGSYAATVS